MARQRFIWPQLWDDPDLGELDEAARLLYIGCFSLADDEGRILGDPVYLKSAVFKYRPAMTPEQVLAMRGDLERVCRHFTVYEVRGNEYIVFKNWSDFQKPKYPSPSRLPPPPKTSRKRKTHLQPAPESQTDSGNDSGNRSGSDSGSDSAMGWVGLGSGKSTPPSPTLVVDDARDSKDDDADEASSNANVQAIIDGQAHATRDLSTW